MTDRTTRPDHWHKWPFEVDCGIPEERTALTAEEDDLRRFFMDRGWVIQMDDRPGQSVHPFADLAAALRTVIIEAKAQGRAAAHPPATVPEPPLPRGWRPDTATIPEPGTPPATVPEPWKGLRDYVFASLTIPALDRDRILTFIDEQSPPATVPDEGLRETVARMRYHPDLSGRSDDYIAGWDAATRALSATKAQEP